MAMKQTQTKMFEFSDTGLDFCSGSKNLFPDRFKKMLALGFNEKTVTGVVVAGNQVTFSYEFAHGYAANRVLKVNSGPLATLHGGEFWIDSVTANTLTMTIESAPLSIASGFVTKIAPLGWELVYELNHVHIYKFKHLDDTAMYARLCFQNATTAGRNCIAVGIGRQVDLTLGTVPDAPFDLGSCATTAASTARIKWDFTYDIVRSFDNFTYAQGLSQFGKAAIVGSKYHIFIAGNAYTDDRFSYIYGIFPLVSTLNNLNYPALLCCFNTSGSGSPMGLSQHFSQRIYVNTVDCVTSLDVTYTFPINFALKSFYPSSIEPFNTTGCFPIQLFTKAEKQPLGFIAGGLYQAAYTNANKPPYLISQSPSITTDIDFNSPVVLHGTSLDINNPVSWLCSPVEEVKIGA